MRLIGAAAAIGVGAFLTVYGLSGSASLLGKLTTHVEVPAVGAADTISAEAARRHDHDFRKDAPAAGKQCTPSPMWGKKVDPTGYEIGCKEVEVRV